MHIQESGEMYLETILVLSKKNQFVRSIDVGEYMGYSKPSVSRAIGLLKKGGYVTSDSDGHLSLTDEGRELAEKVVAACEKESNFKTLYADELSIKDKIATIAKEIYGAADVVYEGTADKQLSEILALNPDYAKFPVCMAKTQYSLSDDPAKLGRPTGFTLTVREIKLSAGAQFIVVLTGTILTMPGLPKAPAAYSIDVDDAGKITGLF